VPEKKRETVSYAGRTLVPEKGIIQVENRESSGKVTGESWSKQSRCDASRINWDIKNRVKKERNGRGKKKRGTSIQ